jgi:hypothetical protein
VAQSGDRSDQMHASMQSVIDTPLIGEFFNMLVTASDA